MSDEDKYIVSPVLDDALDWMKIGQMKDSQFKGLDYVISLRKYCIEHCGGDLAKARDMESYLIGK